MTLINDCNKGLILLSFDISKSTSLQNHRKIERPRHTTNKNVQFPKVYSVFAV